ncbi:SDR family oxidoreductase [Catenisphaera adipataccumulans]|jgi:dTDP-4-dehydrorhamnose reductase|uniref:dTDP-4-dehydrorhamnose reductase n=1 Tax=Catenisphaera adipataccumulans TaxID=700500 RepID=A0A7W8FVD7_9FIRM|nr:NAD(P)-dependent oxidoreductase [Catenisphaera adipataccumulans]MBB5183023.1 dTDP-4-dehydrorhamnose reductase [Catenisphaera adipataccumulans]
MYKNTIWITGAEGRLGAALQSVLSQDRSNKVIATDLDVDITDQKSIQSYADLYRPDVIINCAALSDARYCEDHMVDAFKVNALGARNLATASRRMNAKIIQFSTDDVFSGFEQHKWIEYDMPHPDTVYGKSKYAGETYIRELNPKHVIVRSSWVYGHGKDDYLHWVLDKGRKNESFEAPVDWISTPTSSIELAKVIQILINTNDYGLYHITCEGTCSRHEYARTILSMAGYDPTLAKGSFLPNNQPRSTLLENLMLKMTNLYEMPHWHDALQSYMNMILKEERNG